LDPQILEKYPPRGGSLQGGYFISLCRSLNLHFGHPPHPHLFGIGVRRFGGEDQLDGAAQVFDDVLATGGTVLAACQLVENLGGQVISCAFIVNLTYLNGDKKLKGYDVFSLIDY